MLQSAEVAAFAALVEEYCAFIEDVGAMRPGRLLLTAQRVLPRLYAAALRLPTTWRPPDETAGVEDVEGAREIQQQIGDRISDVRYYTMVAPYESDNADPVVGDLAGDLTDIYVDLRRGMANYRRGQIDAAAWEWQFHFGSHWGRHAVDAIRALHGLAFDKAPLKTNPDG